VSVKYFAANLAKIFVLAANKTKESNLEKLLILDTSTALHRCLLFMSLAHYCCLNNNKQWF